MFQSLAQPFRLNVLYSTNPVGIHTPLRKDERAVNRMQANGSNVKKHGYVMYYVMQEDRPGNY